MSLNNDSMNMEMQEVNHVKLMNVDAELFKSKQAYIDLLKNHSQLEKHCISLEVSIQLKQEVFQNVESCVNQNAVEIQEYFEINDLKALLQDKDTTISKLKDTIKSLKMNTKEKNVHHDKFKAKQPLDGDIDLACKYAIRIQELLVYVQDTFPNAITPSTKKVAITPMNNVEKVRLSEPLTSSRNIKQVESSNTSNSNTPVLSSIGVKCSISNCGSKPPGKKKNDRILQTPSKNKKNKVEAQPKKVNKVNHVVKPVYDVDIKHSLSNANSDILCATCNKSMFDGVHDKCLFDLMKNGNNHAKSAKKHKKQNIWKPTGHVFTEVGFKWKPTSKTFTIVGNSCPLTRFTSTNVVPLKQTTSHLDDIQKPELKVYSRKSKNVKNIGSSKKAKIVKSKNANHSEPNQTWGSNATYIPLSSSLVMTGYPDCTLISGLRMFETHDKESLSAHELWTCHNLFSVGQFCDADLEVAFRKNTCFILNLEGVDLLLGSRDINLYTISLDDMLKSSLICLLSKASKTKSWLWHRRLSHLNFGTLNKLAKDGLTRGIPRHKFQKDHDNPSHVYKLKKALYGLKQASRAWYDMLSSFIISQQFFKGAVNPTLFIRHAGNDNITGLQISQSPRGIFINQSKYASKIVKKYGLHTTDYVDTPMIENKKLDEDLQGKQVDANTISRHDGNP
ncbi:integrase, catalytic region, zinc finger, CCHC-type containing protein [Tanacetum coccineum]